MVSIGIIGFHGISDRKINSFKGNIILYQIIPIPQTIGVQL